MTLTLDVDEVEIEKLHPGPIIHIFPKDNPEQAVEEIIRGLYLLNDIKTVFSEMDQLIKDKEQPNYILLAFAELRRLLEKSLVESEKYSLKFMEKKNFKS